MALRSGCAVSRPRHSPWGDLLARLADEAMEEGCEVGGDGVCGLGLTGVDVCPFGLRFLDFLEGGGRIPQRLQGVDGSVPPTNWSIASL